MPPSTASRGGPGSGAAEPRVPGIVKPGGLGGKTILHARHRKIAKDNIQGITRPDIRRLARRGGVKRISQSIYQEAREALKSRLTEMLKLCVLYCEHRNAKTVSVHDVLHSLRRLGTPIYGFDPDTYTGKKTRTHHRLEFSDAREHQ